MTHNDRGSSTSPPPPGGRFDPRTTATHLLTLSQQRHTSHGCYTSGRRMADYGRIQAIVIATVSGNVVYERFYNAFTDLGKAELRASLQQVDCAADHYVHVAAVGVQRSVRIFPPFVVSVCAHAARADHSVVSVACRTPNPAISHEVASCDSTLHVWLMRRTAWGFRSACGVNAAFHPGVLRSAGWHSLACCSHLICRKDVPLTMTVRTGDGTVAGQGR